MILQCENHHKLTVWGVTPLLVLDVFEGNASERCAMKWVTLTPKK